jgi:hypothetical protein
MRWQIDARTPEDLAIVVEEGKRLGMVRRNLAQARVHRKCHFNDFVEDRLVAGCTEGTAIFRPGNCLEGGVRVNHTAAAGAENVPEKIK